jgi:hypothetical protein
MANINPILAGLIQMSVTTSIRMDRKVQDDIVEGVPPAAAPPAKAIELTMSETQAITKMVQCNATLLKVSEEEDALIRMLESPPLARFDWAVDRPVKKEERAVSLGMVAEAPVPKQ